MKKESTGTIYVPSSELCQKEHLEQSSDSLHEETRIKSVTDFYMFNTVACVCTTFLFPPFILLAAYFLYRAKKGGRS